MPCHLPAASTSSIRRFLSLRRSSALPQPPDPSKPQRPMVLVLVGTWPQATPPPLLADLSPEARCFLSGLLDRNTKGPNPIWTLLGMARGEAQIILVAVCWCRWMGPTPYGLVAIDLGRFEQATITMTYFATKRAVRDALAARTGDAQ